MCKGLDLDTEEEGEPGLLELEPLPGGEPGGGATPDSMETVDTGGKGWGNILAMLNLFAVTVTGLWHDKDDAIVAGELEGLELWLM